MDYPSLLIPEKKLCSVYRRFMGFVSVDLNTGCWNWNGYICKRGYSRFYLLGRSAHLAHRVAYALFKSPIRYGKVIDHKCSNPQCVNPGHLQMVTQEKNIKLIHRRADMA